MGTKRFEVDLPEEVLAGFGWKDPEVPHKVREALVMELLRRDQLSEAQTAELLRLNRWELLELMGRHPTVLQIVLRRLLGLGGPA